MGITDTLKHLIADKTGVESDKVTLESHFEEDLNLSRIELADFLNFLEDHFKINLQSRDVVNIKTVGDLKNLIYHHLNQI